MILSPHDYKPRTSRFTVRDLTFQILQILIEAGEPKNQHNVIGRGDRHPGDLERRLEVRFEEDERQLAGRAFRLLRDQGLIHNYYPESNAEDWFKLSAAGKWALENHALDDLDKALQAVHPSLVECRDGAWTALLANSADAPRQAAASLREMLKNLNPNPAQGDRFATLVAKYKPKLAKKRQRHLASTLHGEYLALCELHELEGPTHDEVARTLMIVEATLQRTLL
jgi:hypothetical protein